MTLFPLLNICFRGIGVKKKNIWVKNYASTVDIIHIALALMLTFPSSLIFFFFCSLLFIKTIFSPTERNSEWDGDGGRVEAWPKF